MKKYYYPRMILAVITILWKEDFLFDKELFDIFIKS